MRMRMMRMVVGGLVRLLGLVLERERVLEVRGLGRRVVRFAN